MKFFAFCLSCALLFSCSHSLLGAPENNKEHNFLSSSEKWWLNSQSLSWNYFQGYSKSSSHLKKSFHKVEGLSKKINKSTQASRNAAHLGLNMNNVYLPYDDNRAGKEIPAFYYNASSIQTPAQSYILSQAPSKKSVRNFFTLIIKKNCPLVVSLVMPGEGNGESCFPFWETKNLPMCAGDWVVTRQGVDSILYKEQNQRLVKRDFVAIHKENDTKKYFSQLHLENLPDHSVPHHKIFLQLLAAVDKMHINPKNPILAHCRAGIGRSGTFVFAHSLRRNVLEQVSQGTPFNQVRINAPLALLNLRLQRAHAVSHKTQYQAALKTVIELKTNAKPKVPPKHSQTKPSKKHSKKHSHKKRHHKKKDK